MKNILKFTVVTVLFLFVGYWYKADYKITHTNFWKFGFGTYDFPYLNSADINATNEFLRDFVIESDKYEVFLNSILLKLHCELIANECKKVKFITLKEKYTAFVELSTTLKNSPDNLNLISDTQRRFSKFFKMLEPMDNSFFSPIINFDSKKDDATIIISVSPEKNQPSSNMLESTGCDINLDVSNDILVGSTFFISLSDLNTKKISSCEARLMYDFFNISGANYAQSNLSPVDRNITSMLTLEFYRWLRSNELYPNTSEELKANVKIFLQYIIESFKKVK